MNHFCLDKTITYLHPTSRLLLTPVTTLRTRVCRRGHSAVHQLYTESDKLSLSDITIEGPANLSQLCQTVTADKILLLFVVRQCGSVRAFVWFLLNKTKPKKIKNPSLPIPGYELTTHFPTFYQLNLPCFCCRPTANGWQ